MKVDFAATKMLEVHEDDKRAASFLSDIFAPFSVPESSSHFFPDARRARLRKRSLDRKIYRDRFRAQRTRSKRQRGESGRGDYRGEGSERGIRSKTKTRSIK